MTSPKTANKRKPKQKKKFKNVQEFLNSVEPKPEYIKHLIECRCYLPQFKDLPDPPQHKFIVFSELDNLGNVKPSYAQCNNCAIVHKVTEVGESTLIKKEEMLSLPKKEDFKNKLPEWLLGLLEEYSCDLHIWLEADFIIKHKLWGRYIVLTKDRIENEVVGKICIILGEKLYNIESFEREEKEI